MEAKQLQERRYILAQKKVKNIKKFYKHLAAYLLVNTFLSTIFIIVKMNDGDTFTAALFQFSTFQVWLFWGIGVVLDAFKTFGSELLLSKDWEEGKIKEFMNKEKNNL